MAPRSDYLDVAILENVSTTVRTSRRRLRWVLPFVVAGAVFIVGVLVIQQSSLEAVPEAAPETPLSVRGTLALHGWMSFYQQDSNCIGNNGYEDIRYGTPVTVYDGTQIVAVGSLGLGQIAGTQLAPSCDFAFSVNVPRGADFYSVEISHRGRLNYPAEQLNEAVQISLGR
jgi:hypothetical protein